MSCGSSCCEPRTSFSSRILLVSVLSNKVLNRWSRDLEKEAGVRRIASHGARHAAGSSYAVMGAGQKVIGTLLGHRNSASTERYTHIAPSATTAIVEARWLRLGGGGGGRCAWRMCGASIIPRGYGAARVRQRLACSSTGPPRWGTSTSSPLAATGIVGSGSLPRGEAAYPSEMGSELPATPVICQT